jgi:hypothetical protein
MATNLKIQLPLREAGNALCRDYSVLYPVGLSQAGSNRVKPIVRLIQSRSKQVQPVGPRLACFTSLDSAVRI